MMRTALTLAALMLMASSCASEDDDEPLSGYSQACVKNEDCETGLNCAGGTCTVSCTATAQCATFGARAACVSLYCRDVCMVNSQCSVYGVSCNMNAGLTLPPGRGVCQ